MNWILENWQGLLGGGSLIVIINYFLFGKKTKEKMSKNSYRCRKVIDISINIIYNTLKEVSILFNIKPSTLSHYLNNTRTNKTTFKYLNND